MPPAEPMAASQPAIAHDAGAADATDAALSAEQHAAWWREWVERGPQGPIADAPDDELPDEP